MNWGQILGGCAAAAALLGAFANYIMLLQIRTAIAELMVKLAEERAIALKISQDWVEVHFVRKTSGRG